MKYPKSKLSFLSTLRILSLPLLILSCFGVTQAHTGSPAIGQTILLWNSSVSGTDSIDQDSFLNTLECMGLEVTRMNVTDLDDRRLHESTFLVAPHASASVLSKGKTGLITRYVKKGLTLIIDGESPLSRAMNFQIGEPEPVQGIIDHSRSNLQLRWADSSRVPWIKGISSQGSRLLVYSSRRNNRPLAVVQHVGKGQCLFMAPLFDPISGKGFARFVTLPQTIAEVLHRKPAFQRQGVDAYFDPGYRFAISLEKLVRQWRAWGIRAVHAAVWYSYDDVPYDYARLIRAAHENGILVYAWLEWPYVGRGFWEKHPEWRQKNALLQDAHLDFLYLMDLQNPECMQAALSDLRRLLKCDWDGIDIAEFTITGAGGEALAGPSRPDYFTGFGPTARAEFRGITGFDQTELCDAASRHYWERDSAALNSFYRYRAQVNNRLLRQVVEDIVRLEKEQGRDWELIHTIVDNSQHREFDQLLGFDLVSTLRLVKEYDITLHVEDPYMEWVKSPERYAPLGETYRRLVGENRFMIDINIVPIHPPEQVGYSTAQATGSEILQLWQEAARQTSRVCFYSESSVYEHDWKLLPFAMGGGVKVLKSGYDWLIETRYTVSLGYETLGQDILLDGLPWPCYGDHCIVIPRGKHRLRVSPDKDGTSNNTSRVQLLSVSDELLKCRETEKGIELEYVSPARCAIALSKRPHKALLDGILTDMPVLRRGEVHVVLAPSGQHRVSFALK